MVQWWFLLRVFTQWFFLVRNKPLDQVSVTMKWWFLLWVWFFLRNQECVLLTTLMFPDWQALVPSQLIQQTVSGKPAKDKMSGISGLVTIAAVLVHEISKWVLLELYSLWWACPSVSITNVIKTGLDKLFPFVWIHKLVTLDVLWIPHPWHWVVYQLQLQW